MNEEIYLGNNIYFSEERNHLINGNITLTISEKEKKLLSFFLRNPEKELTKNHLITATWENRAATIDDANLTQLIYKIRRDLAAVNLRNCIKTLPGKGYIYIPEKNKAVQEHVIEEAIGSKTECFICSALTITAVVMAFCTLCFFLWHN
ncbi:winged helix-turn-helix domain-containing protein [Erwinia sp.]|uniref:winged helix-turn-helix domain-containing protein n=1 Tax=Erwinia citreus TaxID=558 RepID=UPI00289A7B50|nr:winged helix-turn-helix domain-containing protein [Erwinia sp.]